MKKEIQKLIAGILCLLWIIVKIDQLIIEGHEMTNSKKTFIFLGFVAFSFIGAENLKEWWKLRKQRKANE